MTTRTHASLAALALALFACQGATQAAPSRFDCVQSVESGRILVSAPAGWTSFVASPVYLNGAAPSDGPPEKLGILRGEAEKTTKYGWSHRYSLAGPYPDGKWLRCDYGTLGEFSLAKRLPDDVRECTVSGRKGEHAGENIISVVCR